MFTLTFLNIYATVVRQAGVMLVKIYTQQGMYPVPAWYVKFNNFIRLSKSETIILNLLKHVMFSWLIICEQMN